MKLLCKNDIINLYKKEIGYKFCDKKVEQLYSILEYQVKMLEVFNDENFPILYNIYLETYGIDETADKVMDAFNRFYNMQSQYLLHVFFSDLGEKIYENAIDIDDVKKARQEYEKLMMKIIVRLKRANELIYY